MRLVSMRVFSASGNRESWSGSCLSTIEEFGSIQISDTRISDRCSDVFVKNKITKMCPRYLFDLHQT